MITLPITKMHGALNDFILVDNRRAHRAVDLETLAHTTRFHTLAQLGKFLCDRHEAVGADGLLLIDESHIASARMRVINSDGSEAEMCGNGIRCVARYLVERLESDGEVTPKVLYIETVSGIVEATVTSRAPEFIVRANIGTPIFEKTQLAENTAHVSMGNPHVVIFESLSRDGMDVNLADSDLVSIAAPYQQTEFFPHGTNVHLAIATKGNVLEVRHWERGVGETMACGTGAVASAAAAIRAGLATSPVEVRVPGGRLIVEWDGEGVAYMSGPAVRVFDAEVLLETGA